VDREAKEELLAAIGRLPDKLRRVVTCRYLLELDEADTAVVLGVPRGTVKSRLSRGLARLRAELDPEARGKEAGHV
jgi:RNA polymerase sigma-70 factor (ECF subfamily)